MRLTPMRYKDYVWPHNPRTYTITYSRSLAEHKVPYGRYVLENMGQTARIMRGQGEFVGEGAYEEFKKLATVFYGEGPGVLVHPVWQTARAYFTGLELAQQPRPDYVSYRFEFRECYDSYEGKIFTLTAGGTDNSGGAAASETTETTGTDQAVWHSVTAGETLWGIAQRYGQTLPQVLALNPGIRNPNLIYVGDRIRVS